MSLNKECAATEVRDITRSRKTSTKVRVFMSTQPVFIDLVLTPSSYLRMFGGKSCMSRYSYLTCRQCRNATVDVANNFGLPSHARTRNSLLLAAFGKQELVYVCSFQHVLLLL